MSLWLKQSTPVVISFGPFVLNTDGVTLVTNLVGTGANQTENTSTGIRISKNGGAFAARHATAAASSYDAYGNYLVTLDATDTGTLGVLRVQFQNAAAFCPVWQDFEIVAANIYDSFVGGGDVLDVSVIQLLGTAWLTPIVAGTPDVNTKLINNVATTSVTTINANIGVTQPINFTGTAGSALVKGDAIDWASGAIPSPAVTGVPKVDLLYTIGTILTEGAAGRLAAGIIKWFNVATPTGTVNSIPDAVAGAASGLAIVGSNMGTVTSVSGSVNSVTTRVTANTDQWAGTTIPAPAVTGVPKVDLLYAIGTILTEGAVGRLAGAIIKWFNVASPTGTVNSIPDAVAGASGGLAIVGSNMGTVTSVSGSVGSVSGNVGGNVAGSVGSVAGNVTGSVGSVASGGITASSFAANALDAVWSTATRTLTAFGFSVTVGTNNDKTGYALSTLGIQAIWDALTANLITAGSIGKRLVDFVTTLVYTAPLDATAIENAVWDASQASHVTAGTTGKSLSDAGAGGTPPTVPQIVDGVWDELIAGHLGAGSTGAALNNAGASGDPWATALPDGYAAGEAGFILGNLSAATFPVGAIEVTFTVLNSITSLPIDGARVWISTDLLGANTVWSGTTNAFGIAINVNNEKPFLNAGTYYAWIQDAGYTDTNPTTIVVS